MTPGRHLQSGRDAGAVSRGVLVMWAFALMCVSIPALFWWGTWYGRRLPDAALEAYLADDAKADHEAQARCYRAFFEAWTETVARPGSRALGFNCYFWDPYHSGGPDDTGYGVRGKPAERVIASSFERIKKTAGEQKDSSK